MTRDPSLIAQWVCEYRSGDPGSKRRIERLLYDAFESEMLPIVRTWMRLGNDPGGLSAHDIFQSGIRRWFEILGDSEFEFDESRAGGLLRKILRDKYAEKHRRKRPEGMSSDRLERAAGDAGGGLGVLSPQEEELIIASSLEDTMDRFGDRDRMMIKLYVEGRGPAEIAASSGRSLSTVRHLIARFRAALIAELFGDEGEEAS